MGVPWAWSVWTACEAATRGAWRRARRLGPERSLSGALTPSLVHPHDGPRAPERQAHRCRAERRRLPCGAMVAQEGRQRVAEGVDERPPIDPLHRLGGSLAHAVRVEIAPITAHAP
jgi:hypothetical protein